MKRIHAKEQYCLGCRLCEINCLVKHSRSKKLIKAFREEKDDIQSGICVEEDGVVSFALQCRHCTDAPCIQACITGAMHRDPETGAVVCDEDKCVGCWSCIMICPVGAVRRGKKEKVASKCDLCMGEEIPVCVANCPNEALEYREDEEEEGEDE